MLRRNVLMAEVNHGRSQIKVVPEVDVSRGQPLQSRQVQQGELVPGQAQPLQPLELLQHRGDAVEAVEGEAQVD